MLHFWKYQISAHLKEVNNDPSKITWFTLLNKSLYSNDYFHQKLATLNTHKMETEAKLSVAQPVYSSEEEEIRP